MDNVLKSNHDKTINDQAKKRAAVIQQEEPIIANKFEFDSNENEILKAQQNEMLKAATHFQKTKDKVSSSTKTINIKIEGDKFFFANLEDIHIPEGDMLATIELIISLAKIPGMLIGIGGDLLNNAIRNSVSDAHGEIMDTEAAIKSFATALKARAEEEGIDLSEKIVYIRSGNHENRTKNIAAIDPAYVFSVAMGLTNRYVKNTVRVVVKFFKKITKKFFGSFVIEANHGSKTATKPGQQADSVLKGGVDQGADLYVRGHNHSKMSASESKSFYVAGMADAIQKETSFWNSGAHIPGGEYADYATMSLPAMYDGEVAVISVLENGERHVDFINMRSLMAKYEVEQVVYLEDNFKKLEKEDYTKRSDIKKSYLKLSTKLTKQILKNVKTDQEARQALLKRSGLSENLYLAFLSGFMIGEDASQITKKEIKAREEQIKKHIDILSKLNGSCRVVLNGNMVFYKKAFTLVNKNGNMLGEKFPEESFAYLEVLAKTLYPIRDKIVAWNSGEQEEKIMKYQSEALAKMAMTRLQMPESLCYEPYDKTRLEAEQLKVQSKQVETHNKAVLEKTIDAAMKNVDEAIKQAIPYYVENFDELTQEEQEAITKATLKKYHDLPIGVEYNEKGKPVKNLEKNLKLDYLKDILSKKLRAEGEFLSLTEDIDYINYKFPLQEVELREPHKNLIPNILFAMLELDQKKIAINSNSKETAYFNAKVKDEKGKTRLVGFKGGFMNNGASRDSVENTLRRNQSGAPGAHVYFTNSKIGKEFVIIDKQTYTNPITNEFVAKDAIFISGGSYNKANGSGTSPVNKVYKIFVRSNPTKEDPNATGIYDNIEDDMKVVCESWNYSTVLSKQTILHEYMKDLIKRSYLKTTKKFEKKQQETKAENDLLDFDYILDDAPESPKQNKSNDKQLND